MYTQTRSSMPVAKNLTAHLRQNYDILLSLGNWYKLFSIFKPLFFAWSIVSQVKNGQHAMSSIFRDLFVLRILSLNHHFSSFFWEIFIAFGSKIYIKNVQRTNVYKRYKIYLTYLQKMLLNITVWSITSFSKEQ